MSPIQPTTPVASPETTAVVEPTTGSTAQAPAATPKTVAAKIVRARVKKVLLSANPVDQPTVATPVTPVARVATRQPVKKAPAKAVATAVKTASRPAARAVKAAVARPATEKLLKDKKLKMVRDSFTIPKVEYLMLDQLKQRSGILGNAVKKSELIRAGIKALEALSDANFLAAVKAVPTIKTGRPSNN
ncbi:MAG TPA: hypothetical protein PLB25_09495 [Rhodoferax sp.]|nr:hypothetical protein [Rhodoferax sp.]